MKSNELMIGDFLRYKQGFPDTNLQGKIVKVCGVRGRVDVRTIDDGKFHESEHPDWLEPIPLTPEILEKNGFIVKHPESEKRTYWRDATGTIVGHKNRGLMYMDITGNPERFGDFHPMFHGHIRYVHELQHALRLCGIEKEIVL